MKHYFWLIRHMMFSLFVRRTIGARALIMREEKILLVKHTYMSGWYSVGGGVEKGETPIAAVARELVEEVGIICQKRPKLFNVYLNNHQKRDDYVILYIVEDFIQKEANSPEILAMQWFDIDNLPEDVSPATKRRIEEFLGQRIISEEW